MEYHLFVSRRETVTNTLLGGFLLLSFFACLAAVVLVAWLGISGLDWIFRVALPGKKVPMTFSILGLSAAVSLWQGMRAMIGKRWRNAILFLISVPLLILVGLTFNQDWSLDGRPGPSPYFFLALAILGVADRAKLSWTEFSLAVSVAASAMAVKSGWLGDGVLSQTVVGCDLAVIGVWWVAQIRGNYKRTSSDQQLDLPQAVG